MKQPWKQWSWKQRMWFGAPALVLSASVLVLIAVDDSAASFIALGIAVVLLMPATYVMVSAANAAERRFAAGEENVFPARAEAARRRQEQKKRRS